MACRLDTPGIPSQQMCGTRCFSAVSRMGQTEPFPEVLWANLSFSVLHRASNIKLPLAVSCHETSSMPCKTIHAKGNTVQEWILSELEKWLQNCRSSEKIKRTVSKSQLLVRKVLTRTFGGKKCEPIRRRIMMQNQPALIQRHRESTTFSEGSLSLHG